MSEHEDRSQQNIAAPKMLARTVSTLAEKDQIKGLPKLKKNNNSFSRDPE